MKTPNYLVSDNSVSTAGSGRAVSDPVYFTLYPARFIRQEPLLPATRTLARFIFLPISTVVTTYNMYY